MGETDKGEKERRGRESRKKIKLAEWLFLICNKYKELANSLDF